MANTDLEVKEQEGEKKVNENKDIQGEKSHNEEALTVKN